MVYRIQREDGKGSTLAVHTLDEAIWLREQLSNTSDTRYTISDDEDATPEELFLGNIIKKPNP